MPDIIQQIREKLQSGENAEVLHTLLPELFQQYDDGLIPVLPCGIGATVYRICKCEDIPEQLDGTMYGPNGGPGTATGYYCPFEQDCPFDTDDCNKVKTQLAVFEDYVTEIHADEEGRYMCFRNTRGVDIEEFGKTVFLFHESAEAALQERKK
jgi:hypothetical protein